MKIVFLSALLASALGPAAVTGAEESLEALKDRFRTHSVRWNTFGQGSWIEQRVVTRSAEHASTAERRETLLRRDSQEKTLGTREVKRSRAADGSEVVELGESHQSTTPTWADMTYTGFKEVRREELEVGGAKLACRVVEATCVYRIPRQADGETERTTQYTIWFCADDEAGAGILKLHVEPDAAGPQEFLVFDIELVERNRTVTVGDRSVTCSVWRYKGCSLDKTTTTSGETWNSPEIPGGTAKASYQWARVAGASTTEIDGTIEVTAMQIFPEKTD